MFARTQTPAASAALQLYVMFSAIKTGRPLAAALCLPRRRFTPTAQKRPVFTEKLQLRVVRHPVGKSGCFHSRNTFRNSPVSCSQDPDGVPAETLSAQQPFHPVGSAARFSTAQRPDRVTEVGGVAIFASLAVLPCLAQAPVELQVFHDALWVSIALVGSLFTACFLHSIKLQQQAASLEDIASCYAIKSMQTLGFEEDTKAQRYLSKLAAAVEPIMARHKLSVPRLVEFYPNQPDIMGANVGGGQGRCEEIRVRLRAPASRTSFLPFCLTRYVLLHELVHNVWAPHDDTFDAILEQMTEECKAHAANAVPVGPQKFDSTEHMWLPARPLNKVLLRQLLNIRRPELLAE